MIDVSVETIALAQRYDEIEYPFIEELLYGAVAFLQNAGAYKNNSLTRVAIHLIVGNWLENRDLHYSDYKNTNQFPIGIQSIITQLQYVEE